MNTHTFLMNECGRIVSHLLKKHILGVFFLCHLFFYFLIFMFLNGGCTCLSSGFIYIKHEVFVTKIILKSLNKTLKNQLQSAFPIHRFHICRFNQPWVQNVQEKVLIVADTCCVFRPVMVCLYWTSTDFFSSLLSPEQYSITTICMAFTLHYVIISDLEMV